MPEDFAIEKSQAKVAPEHRVVMVHHSNSAKANILRELKVIEDFKTVELSDLDELIANEAWLSAPTFCLLIEDSQLNRLSSEQKKQWIQRGLPIVGLSHGDKFGHHELVSYPNDFPNLIDCINCDSSLGLFKLLECINRIRENAQHQIMVLYPETVEREYLIRMLKIYRFNVATVSSIAEALSLLEERKDFRIAIVGPHLGTMSGVELIRCLRSIHDHDRLAILGLSEQGTWSTAQSYLKSGANDFLLFPFSDEEFYFRLLNIVRTAEIIDRLTSAATRDHLTGLHNRRFLFDLGSKLFASTQRGQIAMTVGMVDIDHFKAINDTFGHEAGNEVLRRVADILGKRFRKTDVVARIGGEEFAILMVNMTDEGMRDCFEGLRQRIESEFFCFKGLPVQVTASFGVTNQPASSLQELLEHADKLLYLAKGKGRNRIEFNTVPAFSSMGD
jgi:diguanylate cyclase (GGDEF)-like protein